MYGSVHNTKNAERERYTTKSIMKLFLLFSSLLTVHAFIPHTPTFVRHAVATKAIAGDIDASAEQRLDEIASKLKLQVYDVDTSVYGIDSKDPLYGIENIHTNIRMDKDGSLGLELTQVAHSDLDHRGLVLVSKISSKTLHETPIHVGDTIIGVFAGEFQESTTGLDYDETVDTISRAKQYAKEHGHDSITLELNRLVKRAAVHVVVEDDNGKITNLDALAGDNLRLLLMHHNTRLYDENTHRLDQPFQTGNCGGEGICGTCMVAVREGMSHLNKVGPQEESILTGRPRTWRAACKTVVGADNQEGTTLRIRVHPQTSKMEDELLHP